MIIAIDGPAGTGKSTIAKILAEKLNLTFLNSGGFYRTLTLAILDNKIEGFTFLNPNFFRFSTILVLSIPPSTIFPSISLCLLIT